MFQLFYILFAKLPLTKRNFSFIDSGISFLFVFHTRKWNFMFEMRFLNIKSKLAGWFLYYFFMLRVEVLNAFYLIQKVLSDLTKNCCLNPYLKYQIQILCSRKFKLFYILFKDVYEESARWWDTGTKGILDSEVIRYICKVIRGEENCFHSTV